MQRVTVRSASGSNLAAVGFIACDITLGNKTFTHDLITCEYLMRPLILGWEFLYGNELKVYYSKTGDCRLDYKDQELIATVDIQDELTLSLKSGVHIPERKVAILNVESGVKKYDIGQLFNIRDNTLLEINTLNCKLFQPCTK